MFLMKLLFFLVFLYWKQKLGGKPSKLIRWPNGGHLVSKSIFRWCRIVSHHLAFLFSIPLILLLTFYFEIHKALQLRFLNIHIMFLGTVNWITVSLIMRIIYRWIILISMLVIVILRKSSAIPFRFIIVLRSAFVILKNCSQLEALLSLMKRSGSGVKNTVISTVIRSKRTVVS